MGKSGTVSVWDGADGYLSRPWRILPGVLCGEEAYTDDQDEFVQEGQERKENTETEKK